jgi:nicotinamide-nucleotide amidase
MVANSIAILTIGDELLNGEVSDVNTGAVAEMLARYGYRLRCSLAVPDQEKEICAALDYLMAHVAFVIVTGGLGSTGDDLTARAAARAVGQPLVINDEALQLIRDWFRNRNCEMEPHNECQALLPQWARIIPNPIGTAPGFRLEHENCELFFLPGVPSEMRRMFEQSVLPLLRRKMPHTMPSGQTTLKIFGLPETKIERMIPYQSLPQGVEVAFALDYPLVLVKLKAVGQEAQKQIDQAEALLLRQFGDHLMARDGESVAANIGKMLSSAGLTLSLAESCTGGLIASLLTREPGASSFLERGGVTYANSAKADWLGVPDSILQQYGAVSEPCAKAMAAGLRHRSQTDLALAVTGIAGPDGGTPEKPVGTVFLALASKSGVHVRRYHFHGERHKIQRMSAFMGFEWLRRYALQYQGKAMEEVEKKIRPL